MARERRVAEKRLTALSIERWWPYVASLALSAIWYFGLKASFPSQPTGLLAATGTASAVLVGFLATMNAIILSISGSDVFKAIRKAGYHHELFRYVYEATLGSITLLLLSVVGFFIPYYGQEWLVYRCLWMVVATLSLMQFIRVTSVTFKLLKSV